MDAPFSVCLSLRQTKEPLSSSPNNAVSVRPGIKCFLCLFMARVDSLHSSQGWCLMERFTEAHFLYLWHKPNAKGVLQSGWDSAGIRLHELNGYLSQHRCMSVICSEICDSLISDSSVWVHPKQEPGDLCLDQARALSFWQNPASSLFFKELHCLHCFTLEPSLTVVWSTSSCTLSVALPLA